MKTVGILGGVGPQTTAKMYLSLISNIRNGGGEEYPPIVIYNLPFPFHIEQEAIAQGVHAEQMVPYLIDGARIIEKAGANFGVLPCNTLHAYIEQIRSSVRIPFLSILEETVLVLKTKHIQKVGILASKTTISSGIYERTLRDTQITCVYPSEDDQQEVSGVIMSILEGVKNDEQRVCIQRLCASMKAGGAEAVLLACTDLQLITVGLSTAVPLIDTMDILTQAAVREMCK